MDTNALSAAADREPEALEIVANAERVEVPVIVLGEYRLGIAQSRHRVSYENWLREWIAAVTVLDIDEQTTGYYDAIGLELKKAGKPIPTIIQPFDLPAGDLFLRARVCENSLEERNEYFARQTRHALQARRLWNPAPG